MFYSTESGIQIAPTSVKKKQNEVESLKKQRCIDKQI